MAIDYTTIDNIECIKRRACVPASQILYKDIELLKMMTEELHSEIVPLLMQVKEDHFLTNYDQVIDTSVSEYEIPKRAIGSKLKDGVLLDSNNKERSLPRLNQDQLKRSTRGTAYSQLMQGFFFQDDSVIISPDASTLGGFSLRMKYFRRPNNLVATTSCGQIQSIEAS